MYISSLYMMYLYPLWYVISLCQQQGATQGPRWTAAAEGLSIWRGNGLPFCDALDDCCLVLISNITAICQTEDVTMF